MKTKLAWVMWSVLATAACGSAPGDPGAPTGTPSLSGPSGGADESGPIGKVQEAIQNATFLTNEQQWGLVQIVSNKGYCSGVVVTNNWVLTAKHCILTNGFNFIIQADSKTSEAHQATLASQVALHPDPNVDVGLLKLNSPFSVGNVTSGYRLSVYGGDFNNAIGAPLICLGYGNATPAESSTGDPNFGRPQGAIMQVAALMSPWTYQAVPYNGDGQVMMPGDSGGPCYFAIPVGGLLLLGIQTGLFIPDPADAYNSQVRSDAFAAWVNSTAI